MARTKRKRPRGKERQQMASEDEFYRRYGDQFEDLGEEYNSPLMEQIGNGRGMSRETLEEIRREATDIINAKALQRAPFSVDAPATDDPHSGSGLIWWVPAQQDRFIPLAEHGTIQRENDLRKFTLVAPMILNAMSALIKKAQSLHWFIEAGRNLASKWQSFFSYVEDTKGWDTFMGRLVRAYSESDRGAYIEIIRAAPAWAIDENRRLTERGRAAIERGDDKLWDVVDLHVLDPARCVPTTSREFPLAYDNPHTAERHFLRNYNFLHILDMPGVDATKPGIGLCSVSRAVWAAKEDTMINRYCMEKMSDNPGSGIVAANVAPNTLKTALKKVNAERDARGIVYYKGLIFMPLLDPSGRFSLELLSFAGLPDGFDRMEVYNIIKEIVAAAFGLDVLELGALPGQQLGSARQAGVLSEKARGKGLGALVIAITRELRHKILPANVRFRFQPQDSTEEANKAQIHNVYFRNASLLAKAGVWDADMVNEYLVFKEAVPRTLVESETSDIELLDTEASKAWRYGDIIRIDSIGNVKVLAKCPYKQAELVVPVGADLPLRKIPASASRITKSDIDKTNARRHRRSPDLAGILDAIPTE